MNDMEPQIIDRGVGGSCLPLIGWAAISVAVLVSCISRFGFWLGIAAWIGIEIAFGILLVLIGIIYGCFLGLEKDPEHALRRDP